MGVGLRGAGAPGADRAVTIAHRPPGSEEHRRTEDGRGTLERAAVVSGRLLAVGAAVFAAALLPARLRLVVLPAVLASWLATVLVPPARWLRARGLPPLVTTWAVLLAALAVLAGIAALLATQVVGQFDQLAADVGVGVDDVRAWLVEGPLGPSDDQVGRYFDRAGEQLREAVPSLAPGLLGGAVLLLEVLAGLLLAAVLVFFFVQDGERMAAWAASRLPQRRREVVSASARRGWDALGAYVRGEVVVALVDAVGIGVGLALIGVPLVLPLAALTFFLGSIPLAGATVAGAVAVLVALASGGLGDALWATAVVVAVQQLEGDLVSPLVLGRAVRLHPVVILLALTAGTVVAGLIGAFLAVPATAVAVVVANELRTGAGRGQAVPGSASASP